MNTRDRFNAIMNYTKPDRPMLTPLDAQNGVWDRLYKHFKIDFKFEGDLNSISPRYEGLEPAAHEEFHVDAAGMDINELHREYYKKIVFCGSLSVQSLLPKGTPELIKQEVQLRNKLFSEGGIIVGPTNIMQVDMPTENFIAMCEAIGCLNY